LLILLLVGFLLNRCSLPVSGDTAVPGERRANQVSKRASGSAAKFLGDVVLYELYVADDMSDWQMPKRREVDDRIATAISFLQLHARLHHQGLSIQRVQGKSVKVAGRLPTDPHADPRWTEGVILQGTGKSSAELVQNLREKRAADAVAICLHLDRPGISYNLAYYDRVDPVYASERMVCFRNYPDGRATAAASYAHELLHLFGAGDLYFPYDSSQERVLDARRWFPSDIMLRVDYDIGRLTIGPFTAFRIGWRDALAPRWRHFED
jgi:hypothetical protein